MPSAAAAQRSQGRDAPGRFAGAGSGCQSEGAAVAGGALTRPRVGPGQPAGGKESPRPRIVRPRCRLENGRPPTQACTGPLPPGRRIVVVAHCTSFQNKGGGNPPSGSRGVSGGRVRRLIRVARGDQIGRRSPWRRDAICCLPAGKDRNRQNRPLPVRGRRVHRESGRRESGHRRSGRSPAGTEPTAVRTAGVGADRPPHLRKTSSPQPERPIHPAHPVPPVAPCAA